jgi:hypothetical protein
MYRVTYAALTCAAILGAAGLAVSASAATSSSLEISSSGSLLDRSTIHAGPGNGTAEAVLEGGSFAADGAIDGSGQVTIPVKFSGAAPDSDVVHGSAVFATASGTFTLKFEALHRPFSIPVFDGSWVLTDGTGAYTGMHGTGTVEFHIQGEEDPTPIIDAVWSGSAHAA